MPKFNHVMLDLETLSTRSDACIIQIAAVAFDIETGEIGPRFNAYVNEPDAALRGHVDINTVAFWMRQKFAATMSTSLEGCGAVDLVESLYQFEQWFAGVEEHGANMTEGLWAHGATFDVPVLASAFERCGYSVPWHYRAPRDTRTLFALAPGGMPRPWKDESREHDAQYDCEYQVAQVCEAYAKLRTQHGPVVAPAELTAAERVALKDLRAAALTRGGATETHDDPPVPGGYSGLTAKVPGSPYPFGNQEALNAYAEYERGPSGGVQG